MDNTDNLNISFWNELCGSSLARHIGITDASSSSLKKFDDYYFDFYPYLGKYISFAQLSEKRVLEVGLGYGTVSQALIKAGAVYHGLDIAQGPVDMVKHRLQQGGVAGTVQQGSILSCPFPDKSFDHLISIGCFHHTGNLQKALDEAWRVLKPGGRAIVMVYYAYSYRRWVRSFGPTLRYLLWDRLGFGTLPQVNARERGFYDASLNGESAPETIFVSARQMKRFCRRWSRIETHLENIGGEGPLRYIPRDLANRLFGPWCGLDIYCTLVK